MFTVKKVNMSLFVLIVIFEWSLLKKYIITNITLTNITFIGLNNYALSKGPFRNDVTLI